MTLNKDGLQHGHCGQKAVAKYFGVTLQTIRNWRQHKDMPCTHVKPPSDNEYATRMMVVFKWADVKAWAARNQIRVKKSNVKARTHRKSPGTATNMLSKNQSGVSQSASA